jgi:hypothetical protein
MEATQVQAWAHELDRVVELIGERFTRSEVRSRTGDYLRGLLSGVERKNGWQLAEFTGEASPRNVQHFLGRASWDSDEVAEDLRGYVAEHLADDGHTPRDGLALCATGGFKTGRSAHRRWRTRTILTIASTDTRALANEPLRAVGAGYRGAA